MNRRDLLKLGSGLLIAGPQALRAGAAGLRRADAMQINGPLRGRRAALHRGLPDQPAHPRTVHAGIPEPGAAEAVEPGELDRARHARLGAAGLQNGRTQGLRLRQASSRARGDSGRHGNTKGLIHSTRNRSTIGSPCRSDSITSPLEGLADPAERAPGWPDSPGYGQTHLPPSTIYGFSGTPEIPNSAAFPGAMIYARYGQPVNSAPGKPAGPRRRPRPEATSARRNGAS